MSSCTGSDPATASLLEKAFEEAWFTLPEHVRLSPLRKLDIIAAMTRQLLQAADAGERDHHHLVRAALDGGFPLWNATH